MLNLHLAILKSFLESTVYLKYENSIDYQSLKEEAPEIFRLYQCIRHLQNRRSKDYSLSDLEVALSTLYPASNKEEYKVLFAQLEALSVDPEQIDEYLSTSSRRTQAIAVAKGALGYAEGRLTQQEYEEILNASNQPALVTAKEDWADDDLERLFHRHYERAGIRWKLESLNKALGSLRLGNFGFVFARPETGKTTFLASQLSGFAAQVDKPIWWFTNEQHSDEILTRCYQAVLEIGLVELYADVQSSRKEYLARTKGNIRIHFDANLSKTRVEQLLKQYGASLIIFDQIDPIRGFKADRDDLELTAIYEWARYLAGIYAPVIGVCQAGASADGKRWLTMNDVNNSKTGKQGAADWILGIGKAPDAGLETYRYFHLSKNKLQGDQDSDPAMRHGKWEVKINQEIAQYYDI